MKRILKKSVARMLQWEARMVLRRYAPRIVAVTGSVGKTSTKDAIYSILSSSFFARKSEKSFNSELGVPLTILGCPTGWLNPFIWARNLVEGLALILLKNHYPRWLVLEVGADRPGDIKSIASWLKPDVVVVTRIPPVPVHVEFFRSPEEVAKEKSYLVRALRVDGMLVLNYDDEETLSFKSLTEAKVLTYGLKEGADLIASNYQVIYEEGRPTGITFRVDYLGNSVPVTLRGVIGIQHVYPALCALAVGTAQDLNLVTMGQALSQHIPPPGRMRLIDGIKKTTVIDDTYNSSPTALERALLALKDLEISGRKIAVLGDMLELGSYSVNEHRKAGALAAETIDILVTVGVRARDIAEGAQDAGLSEKNILQYEDSRRAGKELEQVIKEGDVIAIKGSQSIRMERAVEEIMAHPEQREKLLVRQDREWRRR